MTTTVDLRHLDAPRRAYTTVPDFQPADPMDVQQAREVIPRMRLERLAQGFREQRERDGRPA